MEVKPGASAMERVATHEIERFSRLVSDRFAPLTVGSNRPQRFHGVIRGRRLGDIEAFDVRALQHEVERPQALANRSPQRNFMLHLQLAGVGVIRQDGREATLQAGDLAFYDSDRAYSLSLDDQFRNAILVFPQRLLTLPSAQSRELVATRIAGTGPIAGMVLPFLTQLVGALATIPATSALRLADNTVDLISTLVHAELGHAAPEPAEASREEHLVGRAVGFIHDHIADPELSPDQVAAAHFVAVRTLHKYFSAEYGVGVAEWIRGRRLELCRQELASPLQDHQSVATIAARFGFTRPPHFTRLFKATFGETPGGYRRRARLGGDAASAPVPRSLFGGAAS